MTYLSVFSQWIQFDIITLLLVLTVLIRTVHIQGAMINQNENKFNHQWSSGIWDYQVEPICHHPSSLLPPPGGPCNHLLIQYAFMLHVRFTHTYLYSAILPSSFTPTYHIISRTKYLPNDCVMLLSGQCWYKNMQHIQPIVLS